MEEQFAVQRVQGNIHVTPQSGNPPQAGPSQALINMQAASICGADMRIASGDKDAHTKATGAVTMGHEGCGTIQALSAGAPAHLSPGDFVIVLPHEHVAPERAEGCTNTTPQIEAACTSRHHTDHAGWDFGGVFTNLGIFSQENLVVVSPEQIKQAERLSDLGSSIFTITEPMLCCLSAYKLMRKQSQMHYQRDLTAGKALVVGCGPIGTMHGIILAERGYEVTFFDTASERARLAQHCIGGGKILPSADTHQRFDVVIVTANVEKAVRFAEAHVKDNGIVYLFSGMNAGDREASHPSGEFTYEDVHRSAEGVLTRTGDRRVLYTGHSGYYAHLAQEAVGFVSRHADRLSNLLTGVLDGWNSATVRARVPGVPDWQTPDGGPAVTAVLRGALRTHGKILAQLSA